MNKSYSKQAIVRLVRLPNTLKRLNKNYPSFLHQKKIHAKLLALRTDVRSPNNTKLNTTLKIFKNHRILQKKTHFQSQKKNQMAGQIMQKYKGKKTSKMPRQELKIANLWQFPEKLLIR